MKQPLDRDWWLKDPIDFEHKKWLFLAYLKQLDDEFYSLNFSPWLLHSEGLKKNMEYSYRSIISFNKDLEKDKLIITKDSFFIKKVRPKYEGIEIFTDILSYSIPLLENKIDFGRQLWNDNPSILW